MIRRALENIPSSKHPARRIAGRVVFVDDGIQRAGASAVNEFAAQIGVPPETFRWPDVVRLNLVSLAVKNSRLRGIKFQPAMVRVNVQRDAATDIGDRGRIPFLDDAAAGHVNERGREQCRI